MCGERCPGPSTSMLHGSSLCSCETSSWACRLQLLLLLAAGYPPLTLSCCWLCCRVRQVPLPAEVYAGVNAEAVLTVLAHKITKAVRSQGVSEARLLLRDWLIIFASNYHRNSYMRASPQQLLQLPVRCWHQGLRVGVGSCGKRDAAAAARKWLALGSPDKGQAGRQDWWEAEEWGWGRVGVFACS